MNSRKKALAKINAVSHDYPNLAKPYNIDTLNRWVDLAIKEFNT